MAVKSSGNVFADLGFDAEEAANLKLRSQLMIEVEKTLMEVKRHIEFVEVPREKDIGGYYVPQLNKEWEKENIKRLVSLFCIYDQIDSQLHSNVPLLFGDNCSEDEATMIKNLVGESVEKLMFRYFDNDDKETVTLSRSDADALFEAALFPTYLYFPKGSNSKADGRNGGLTAARNRAETRKKFKTEIAKLIKARNYFSDWNQTNDSITNLLWSEIKQAIESGNDWQGIPSQDLARARVGRQTVYDEVSSTAPR